MPLDYNRELIFCHIPKCAGSSIEKALDIQHIYNFYSERKCKDVLPEISKNFSGLEKIKVESSTPQHLTLSQLLKISDKWKNYKKFSVVRNPYDRIVSEYCYIQEFQFKGMERFQKVSFKEFLRRAFLLSSLERHKIFDGHLNTQKSFLYSSEGSPLYDVLFRFEELYKVFEWLDVEPFHLRKNTLKSYWKGYYDKETIEIVDHFYNDDFNLFGYDKYYL